MEGKFVSYLRVSTQRQGVSGLGIEAQRKAVLDYLNGGGWKLVAEFVEVESGKDADNRPELERALVACRVHGATLVVARLDRLSRNAAFLLTLRDSGADFVAADMPGANGMTVGVMALVAQQTRETISASTKAALAAAKARGVKLGTPRNLNRPGLREKGSRAGNAARVEAANRFATDLASTIRELHAAGIVSLNGIARALNDRKIPTPRRNGKWTATAAKRILARLATAPEEKGAA